MANTQIILLEHVDNLGSLGDVVNVKPGYARNFLLPHGKALRATQNNLAFFEAERKNLEAVAEKKRGEAANDAKKLDGLKLVLVRQASEGGQLYGSVAARDIAEAATEAAGITIGRSQVVLNTNIKTIGLFDVTVSLYADVKVNVNINVARSEAEAEIQEKTGKAVISEEIEEEEVKTEAAAEETTEEEVVAEAEATEEVAETEEETAA